MVGQVLLDRGIDESSLYTGAYMTGEIDRVRSEGKLGRTRKVFDEEEVQKAKTIASVKIAREG